MTQKPNQSAWRDKKRWMICATAWKSILLSCFLSHAPVVLCLWTKPGVHNDLYFLSGQIDIHLCIIHFLLWQQLSKQRCPDLQLHSHLWGDIKMFLRQQRHNLCSVGLPQDLCPVGHTLNPLLRWHQTSSSGLFWCVGVAALVDPHFDCMYQQAHSFSHYPQLVTKVEGKNVDETVDQFPQLSLHYSVHMTANTTQSHLHLLSSTWVQHQEIWKPLG